MSDSSSDGEYSNFEVYKKRQLKNIRKRSPIRCTVQPTLDDMEDKRLKIDEEIENVIVLTDDDDDEDYESLSVVERLQKKTEKLKQKNSVVKIADTITIEREIEDKEDPAEKKVDRFSSVAERVKSKKMQKKIEDVQTRSRELIESIDITSNKYEHNVDEEFNHRDSIEIYEVPQIEKCSIKLSCVDPDHYFQEIVIHDMNKPISELLSNYETKLRIVESEMIVFYKNGVDDTRISLTETPRTLGFRSDQINDIEVFKTTDPNINTIQVKFQSGQGRPVMRRIKKDFAFSRIKEEYCEEQKLDPKKFILMYDGDRINDYDTPESLEIEDEDCIDVHFT